MKKWIEINCINEYWIKIKNDYPLFILLTIILLLPISQSISSKFNFNFPQELLGTISYLFIPGYFFTQALFRNKQLNIIEIISLSIAFSLTIPPLLILFINKIIFPNFSLTFFNLYIIYLLFIAICLALGSVNKYLSVKKNIQKDTHLHHNQKIILIVLIFIVSFVVYSFVFSNRQTNIISADSSYFYKVVKVAIENNEYPLWKPNVFPPSAEFYHPLFQFGIISWQIFSSIDLISLFRFGFIFSMGLLLFPLFLLIDKITGKKYSALSLILFFCIPVLIAEINIARPQTLLFYLTPLFLYSVSRWSDNLKKELPWFIVSVIISIAAWFIHFLSVIYIFLLFFHLFIYFWPEIRSNKKKSVFIAIAAIIAIYPYIEKFGISKNISYLYQTFLNSYSGSNLLKNPFGLITYLANYAFAIIPLTIFAIYLLLSKNFKISRSNFIIFSFSGVYFIILEVVPRLGFNFLPDRAFPHLALGLICISSISFQWLFNKKNVHLKTLLILLILISISATIYVNSLPTYHIISQKEIDAVKFINNEKGKSLVATQIANAPMIFQFGNFDFIEYDSNELKNLFLNLNSSETFNQLSYFKDYKKYLKDEEASNYKNIHQLTDNFSSKNDFDKIKIDINKSVQKIEYLENKIKSLDQLGYSNDKINIYILYSRIKNRSFYNRYQWWKETNFINVDLSKFEDDKYFVKIFDNGDTVIWKLKKYQQLAN